MTVFSFFLRFFVLLPILTLYLLISNHHLYADVVLASKDDLNPALELAKILSDVYREVDIPLETFNIDKAKNWNGKSNMCHWSDASFFTSNYNDRSGCLKQFNCPSWLYLSLCAEQPKPLDNDFFNPRIRVRIQNCIFGCWQQNTTLKHGECKVFGTLDPFRLFQARVCARKALSANVTDKGKVITLPDHGYMGEYVVKDLEKGGEKTVAASSLKKSDTVISFTGYHLDQNGKVLEDPAFDTACRAKYMSECDSNEECYKKLCDGMQSKIIVVMPKLCAYDDPWLFQLNSAAPFAVDLFDYNPNSQPIHLGAEMNPIINMIAVLFLVGNQMQEAVVGFLFPFLEGLVAFFGEVVVTLLKMVGSINKIVVQELGCINIPMGPFPPPYCSKLKFFPSFSVQQICPTEDPKHLMNSNSALCNKNGLQRRDSTIFRPCSYAAERNNVIHNSIRVGEDLYMKICDKNISYKKASCVELVSDGSDSNLVEEIYHNGDLISWCGATNSKPCIQLSICENKPIQSSVNIDKICRRPFRVLYKLNANSQEPLIGYPGAEPAPLAGSVGVSNGQSKVFDNKPKIWGINLGEFKDMVIDFQNSGSQSSSETIRDTANQIQEITAHIDPENVKNICALIAGDDEIGCVARAGLTLPLAEHVNCSNPPCLTDHFNPQIKISLKIEANGYSDTVSAILSNPKYKDNLPEKNTPSIELAGFKYEALITNDDMLKFPFNLSNLSSDHFVINNAHSIYGDYKLQSEKRVYTGGLEYDNGFYIRGGTKICISNSNIDECTGNICNCALTTSKQVPCFDKDGKKVQCPNNQEQYLPNQDTDVRILPKLGTDISQAFYDYTNPASLKNLYDPSSEQNSCNLGSEDAKNISTHLCSLQQRAGCQNFSDINAGAECLVSIKYCQEQKCYFTEPNNKKAMIRPKNSHELGLCLDMEPLQKCTSNYYSNKNNAFWPTNIPQPLSISQSLAGFCDVGYVPKTLGSLTEYCTNDRISRKMIFQSPLEDKQIGCSLELDNTENAEVVFSPSNDITHNNIMVMDQNNRGIGFMLSNTEEPIHSGLEFKSTLDKKLTLFPSGSYDMNSQGLLDREYENKILITVQPTQNIQVEGKNVVNYAEVNWWIQNNSLDKIVPTIGAKSDYEISANGAKAYGYPATNYSCVKYSGFDDNNPIMVCIDKKIQLQDKQQSQSSHFDISLKAGTKYFLSFIHRTKGEYSGVAPHVVLFAKDQVLKPLFGKPKKNIPAKGE